MIMMRGLLASAGSMVPSKHPDQPGNRAVAATIGEPNLQQPPGFVGGGALG